MTLGDPGDVLPGITWLFSLLSFRQMDFYASFELSFVSLEKDWSGLEDRSVHKGNPFKGFGVSDLVTEGDIFLCDGEGRAEAEWRGTTTGPGKLTFWQET